MNAILTDKSEMPYGIHKGKTMANVPAKYLIWLYENQKCTGQVKAYIEDNIEVLREEIKREQQ